MVVEILDKDYEFMQRGKPTGHYVRAYVIKEHDDKYEVDLLCNGQKLLVSKKICKIVA